jgi:hypothetical protein
MTLDSQLLLYILKKQSAELAHPCLHILPHDNEVGLMGEQGQQQQVSILQAATTTHC